MQDDIDNEDAETIGKSGEIPDIEDIEDGEIDEAAMLDLLADLKKEHRRIDQEIEALQLTGAVDMLKIRRMKKIKLSIKDQIVYLENMITPDIIA